MEIAGPPGRTAAIGWKKLNFGAGWNSPVDERGTFRAREISGNQQCIPTPSGRLWAGPETRGDEAKYLKLPHLRAFAEGAVHVSSRRRPA